MVFYLIDSLETGSELALKLFELFSQEINFMMFPVFDILEIKDWLINFIKSQSSDIFKKLKEIRNEVRSSSQSPKAFI